MADRDRLDELLSLPSEVAALRSEVARLRELVGDRGGKGAGGIGPTDGYLSVAEAMAFSSLSRSELDRAADRGELIAVKRGKRKLILKRSLVEMLGGDGVIRAAKGRR